MRFSDTSPEAALRSCSAFKTPMVSLDESAMRRFLASDDAAYPGLLDFRIASTNSFPELSFESPLEEAGFIVLVHGLDFGSGFRTALHRHRGGQGAWLTIRAGLVALGKAYGTTVRASWLQGITLLEVKKLFDIDASDLQLLAEQIHGVLMEFGEVLGRSGHETLGAWAAESGQQGACALVSELVTTFPFTFGDSYVVERKDLPGVYDLPEQQHVVLAKKAQLVVSEIHMRFREDTDPRCKAWVFHDFESLSGFIDNVVVAVLRKLGILRCSNELNARIDGLETLQAGSWEEVSLRAKGLVAIHELVEYYNAMHSSEKKLTAAQLCNYMWGGLGKEPTFRAYPRHLTPSTLFY